MENNNNNPVKLNRSKEPKFLIVDSLISNKLSPFALKLYLKLREKVSYTDECGTTEITIKSLADQSGMSERKAYYILNELEYEHHVIKRTNIDTYRYGKINSFEVAQTYNYFKIEQLDESQNTPARNADPKDYGETNSYPVDNIGQDFNTPARNAATTARNAETTAQPAFLKKQQSFQKVSQKKHNTENSVSVFSNIQAVKNHIVQVIKNRGMQLANDVIEQVAFYVGTKNCYSETVKRINIALKKIRENKWNIPHGYQGITSQSIKVKEEEQQKQKQAQYQQEAVAAKAILTAVTKGTNFKQFQEMFKTLKGDMNEKTNDCRGMQECFV